MSLPRGAKELEEVIPRPPDMSDRKRDGKVVQQVASDSDPSSVGLSGNKGRLDVMGGPAKNHKVGTCNLLL